MSRLMTERVFGHRRAVIGAAVLLMAERPDGKPGGCLRAGIVVAISDSQDRPYILDLREGGVDSRRGPSARFRPSTTSPGPPAWSFVETGSESLAGPDRYAEVSLVYLADRSYRADLAAIESMPVGSWTWPP